MKKKITEAKKVKSTKKYSPKESVNTKSTQSLDELLELSRKTKLTLVPKSVPRTQGIEVASLFLPGKAVGGNLYDVIQISEDLIAFYIFDASSRGITSALLSSLAKVSFLKNIHSLTSPKAILERINDELLETICTNFSITAFIAFLDLHSNKLIYCNAGHTFPIIYKRKEKKLIPLETPGVLLGVYKNAEFENDSIYLFPDDWLFLFTCGIYHLFNVENEESARKKLEDIINKGKYKSPSEFLDICRKRSEEVLAEGEQKNDITAVVVEILTQSRRDQLKKELGFIENMPVYLQFLSYYEEIDTVSAHVLRDMDETGYSDESIRKMKLTITELLANAIGHGNKDDHSKKVTMGHMVENTAVTVSVMDEGDGFNPSDIPDPTLPENLIKDHGRGLYIVRNHVDEIHFNKKGSRVLIRKYRFGNR